MLSEADALYGAAYQVLFERVDPDACATREIKAVLDAELVKVSEWAKTQPPDVAAAYQRASADIATRAAERLENNERARQMTLTRKSIPTPP